MAQVLMIIAPKNFRDEEFCEPKLILEKAGFLVKVASTQKSECVGTLGMKVEPDLTVIEAKATDYLAVIVVGGSGSPELADQPEVLNLLRSARDLNLVIGAICAAPFVLAKAEILKGKRTTCYPGDDILKALNEGGATYISEDVVSDGKIVTGNGPKAVTKFGQMLVKVLSEVN